MGIETNRQRQLHTLTSPFLRFGPYNVYMHLWISHALSDPSSWSRRTLSAIPNPTHPIGTIAIRSPKFTSNPHRFWISDCSHGNGFQSANRRGDLQRLQWPKSWPRSCFDSRYFTLSSSLSLSLSLYLSPSIWLLFIYLFLGLAQTLMNFMDSVIQVFFFY